ncbi:MAG: carbamoyltransferase HypF [Candidatus Bipolaricaulota bacterium]
MKKRLWISISGTVQGVGFRPFVYRAAVGRGLAGHVRNLGDAGVEIEVEGPAEVVDAFLQALREEAPPLAEIEETKTMILGPKGEGEFHIIPSADAGEGGGTLPPDVATCGRCLRDIEDPESRYHQYWATSCTDCGPRFTVIEGLPYDRPTTSMRDFPMCEACRREYTDPLDRRYHAQTIACLNCGPRLSYLEQGVAERADSIGRAIQALRAGRVVAVQGIGGTHLACDASRAEVVAELRRRLNRPGQPMAIMAQAEALESFCAPTEEEWALLRSPRRPIVAVRLRPGALPEVLAPGLHTVGVMLPYSGLHHLLLAGIRRPLVMTSGNFPGRPMAITEEEIKRDLGGVADGLLLHNRRIVARCDDSVMRMAGGMPVFLRRSRGWVPEPIPVELGDESLLALGGELNVVFALYHKGKVHLSQHIGDTEHLETVEHLRGALEHLQRITGAPKPRRVVCDLHPGFATSRLAAELGDAVPVQHHVAHVAGLAAEWGVGELVGIAADGYGYGQDGAAWGGEVILWQGGTWERAGSLSEVPLPGGDLAALRPGRMAAAYALAAGLDPERAGLSAEELEAVRFQIANGVNCPRTTSAGRFLDAVAAWLGMCRERTYEGEPAMRLEAAAVAGRPHDVGVPLVSGGGRRLLDAVELFRRLAGLAENGSSAADLAATAQEALARGLARLALEVARQQGIGIIGLTGGVAVNDAVAWAVRHEVEQAGLRFISHRKVPPGDGGLAFGQLAAGRRQCPSSA